MATREGSGSRVPASSVTSTGAGIGSPRRSNSGTATTGVTVAGSTIGSDLALDAGFTTVGAVRLVATTISGNLYLSGADITNPDDNALSCDGAHITGSVLAHGGFTATGTGPATIDGNLELNGAVLTNPGRIARVADSHELAALGSAPIGNVDLPRDHAAEFRDDPGSWPQRGRLILTGFTYDRLGTHTTVDLRRRLDCLRRNQRHSPPPYRQPARHQLPRARQTHPHRRPRRRAETR